MSLTTSQAFSTFLSDVISPTDYHNDTLIPARHKSVVENLEETFPATSDMPFWKSYLIGSASKGTIIRPIDDVDVLAVFSNENGVYQDKYLNSSQDFLYRIRRAYDGVSIQQVGARGQAVRVFFKKGGYVDVAPVFWSNGDDYLLPAGDDSWLLTSPLKSNAWFNAKNQELGYNLKNLVMLLKKWNREHSSYFGSFHLETVAAKIFSSLGTNYRDALYKFFDWAQANLNVYDPGGHGGDLSSYLTYQSRQSLLNNLESAAERAGRAINAEAEGDHEEAKRLWAIILGSDFPTS